MKIAVVAANGKAGKLIVKEAVDRGIEVTAFVRGKTKAPRRMKSQRIFSILQRTTSQALTL